MQSTQFPCFSFQFNIEFSLCLSHQSDSFALGLSTGGMDVYCEYSVLFSGRYLCDELATRPEEACRLWCVVVCDLENS